ncbi:MAG TPA: ATP synthase F1 subunit gamma [Rhodothermales bacterium]|nr:ATP synthase F1 subunit gamma [Rhodothermales bacterium]
MANLKEIRNRIASVINTQQVTSAMKLVAASKLRKAQEQIFATRPYAFKIHEFISEMQASIDPETHPLLKPHTELNNVLIVLISADRGLAGAFNTNVIKKAESLIKDEYAEFEASGNLFMLCLGRKGHDYFARRGAKLVGDYRGYFQNLNIRHNDEVEDLIREGYLEGKWDKVVIVYNEFRNTISQNLIAEPFLPIPHERFITPVMEKFTDEAHQYHPTKNFKDQYIFEPDAASLVNELIPRYLNLQLWRMCLESNAAEQGARMVAMENATNNAGELLRQLKLTYNRERQAAITKEIIEVSSGADALG